jgi:hypothetical protein
LQEIYGGKGLKRKFVLLLLTLSLVIVSSIVFGCSGDNENSDDATLMSDYLVGLGFENCLICHTGGINDINHHCKFINPISYSYSDIQDYSYSPKLSDCLLCHRQHTIDGKIGRNKLNCGLCHEG